MGSILRVRLDNGTVIDIPAIVGAPGKNGEDGHTPVKGVDYYTDEDKTEIVNDVLAALPVAEEASL